MTERKHTEVIEALRSRLGFQYESSMEDGRHEIERVVADEMNVSSDEAKGIVSELIDGGMIRYVTGAERDVEYDVEAQRDEYTDEQNREAREREKIDDRRDNLAVNAIPGQGGPSAATSGLAAGAAAPVAAAGATAPAALPLAAGVDIGKNAAELQDAGYWEFTADRAGVVPSSTRKGQVEPRGT